MTKLLIFFFTISVNITLIGQINSVITCNDIECSPYSFCSEERVSNTKESKKSNSTIQKVLEVNVHPRVVEIGEDFKVYVRLTSPYDSVVFDVLKFAKLVSLKLYWLRG